MNITVITAADGAAWESALLAELGGGSGPFSVVRRCVDVVELVAVAASGQAQAALVDAQLRRLDAEVVERLTAVGVAVVGVVAGGSSADPDRLSACGVAYAVPADATAAALLTVVEAAVADLAGTGAASAHRSFADPAQATGELHRAQPGEPLTPATRRGSVVAVWGPTGAPGRSLLAVNLADEMARLGPSALLVDADVYGAVAASMLGLLDESPGLVAACRQAQSRRLDAKALAALCWQVSPQMRVLTGIARADRWPELRPAGVEGVLDTARELADYTVLDLGFSLETDEELSFDTAAPRRNGATLAALAAADLVLAVGSADPVGLQRLIRGLDELGSVGCTGAVWVVLNRVRPGDLAGPGSGELTGTLSRFAGRTSAARLPLDTDAADHAARAGKTLAEVRPNSALRRAVQDLAGAVTGVQSPSRGRRRA